VHIHGSDETDDAFVEYENLMGRKAAVQRVYHRWSDEFPGEPEEWARDRGTTLIMSWQSSNGGIAEAKWRDIAAGRYDAVIDARAADIKAFGSPMFFTFHHEPDSGEIDTGTSADFVAAWRHMHDRFELAGVTNVSWLLVLLSYTYANDGAAEWYPGDEYVDLLGADGYNWFTCPPGVWKSFVQIFQDFYDYGVSMDKPMMIAEWGSIEDPEVPGAKAAWFAEAAATLKTWPEIKALTYFHEGTEDTGLCDWWIDSSPTALAAFQAMAADPYFNPPPPLVDVDSRPPDLDTSTTAIFTYHANILGSTFTCSLNSGTARVCVSPYTISNLGQGAQTLKIIARDPISGESGYTIEAWTVDSVPPVVSILSHPPADTQDDSASFELDTTEPGSGGFRCSLDGAPPEDCEHWTNYTGLSDGDHVFTATAIDDAGNESAPASWPWTIDNDPPQANITAGPTDLTKSKTATFSFTSDEPGSTFQCSKDGGGYLACTSPKTYNWLTDGPHTFNVLAIDPAKNKGAPDTWSWTVDATRPTVTITSGPANPTNSSQATFTFTATEGNVTFTCQLDSGTARTCTSPKTYTGIGLGEHTFYLYGTDLAGNVSKTVKWRWTRI
jgi:hypothetical protein